jgi:hypothetical protein
MTKIQYGFYSQKQYAILKSHSTFEDKFPFHDKYWTTPENQIVQITEVKENNDTPNSNFDDCICIGQVQHWHGHFK